MACNKTLSFACVLLLLFSAQYAFSIGVDPKSKRSLRKTLKNYSESRSKKEDSAKGKSAAAGSGKRRSSGGSGSGAAGGNSILYTLPDAKVPEKATMVEVEDGDTIRVMLNDSPYTVSLYGIDSPERTQTYGMQAVQTITRLMKSKNISLQIYDKDTENRRCLAVVSVGQKNVNELLVKGGHAWVKKDYCYESFCADWLSYQKKAMEGKKGLWGYPYPMEPWVWRAMPLEKRQDLQQGYSPVANGLRSRYGKDTTVIGE